MRLCICLLFAMVLSGCGERLGQTGGGANTKLNISQDFVEAKRRMYAVHANTEETFYCGCDYDSRKRRIDPSRCGYKVKEDRKRGQRTEAEHVVPASWFGRGRACWTKQQCKDSKGKRLQGRACCMATDADFVRMHNDLHNLVPTVGELNKHRGSLGFGDVRGEKRAYGACDFEVLPRRFFEPRPAIRGDIARIAFYMEQQYGVDIHRRSRERLQHWAKDDPVDAAEKNRNARIKQKQGNGNPLVGD